MSDYKQRCEAYLHEQKTSMNSKSVVPKINKQRIWNQSISKNNQPAEPNRISRLCTQKQVSRTQSVAEKDKFKNKGSTWDGMLANVTLIVFFFLGFFLFELIRNYLFILYRILKEIY